MVCEFTNSRAQVYYLHTVPSKTTGKPLYYFAKTQNNKGHTMVDMDEGYEARENMRSGLPVRCRKK